MEKIEHGLEGTPQPLPEQSCRRCGEVGKVTVTIWESSDGAHEDAHYRCAACNGGWWIDGIDS